MPGQSSAELQRHPYEPWIPDSARALILGSAPPWRFCQPEPKPLRQLDVDYYYGSYDRGCNLFWETMFRVFDPSQVESLERLRRLDFPRDARTLGQRAFLQEWLAHRQLGIADILLRFERRGQSASDGKLTAREFTGLDGILDEHPSLEAIYCTSRGVFHWLRQYLAAFQPSDAPSDLQSFAWPKPGSAGPSARTLSICVLPSPSPIGRVRFPSHQDFVDHLVRTYREQFSALFRQLQA